ncbi:netrin-A isoform X2 [Drosophila busckii]|uniref:netrin-A isoform X2 n=1 Tax=Drosophila busckii TaxID=30019 RepID=UPI00083F190B|nr:netrin-A isoform X2 [Drosophila busckii]
MCALQLLLLSLVAAAAAVPSDIFQARAPEDPCYAYDKDKPSRCIPDFVNAAYDAAVIASSSCGDDEQQPQRYCEYPEQQRPGEQAALQCQTCAADSFPPRALTDLNNSNNVTCWRSAPLPSAGVYSGNAGDNVTLTLSLGKKYELTYVSLQFCPRAPRPDSLAIYKSSDFGHSWQPFQYYSSQCRRLFGRPRSSTVSKHNEQEARCQDVHRHGQDGLASRIAFSVLDGRPSAHELDSSSVLQDWVTATDIRIVFQRLQQPDPHALLSAIDAATDLRTGKYSVQLAGNNIEALGATSAGPAAASGLHYAVSDFSVGGRCKCNGHASKCLPDLNGQLSCECRHNTAGRDCERCKPFHFDRPWGRATERDANECKICNCNNHSRQCRFSMEHFRLSKGVSGGVCQHCRHFTTGRHCQECKQGYYRDPTKPLTHRKACKPCDCHSVGSSGKICDSVSGQCPCKDGVTGLNCNKCQRGYLQSRSIEAPCIKQATRMINMLDTQNTEPEPNEAPAGAAAGGAGRGGGGAAQTQYYRTEGGRGKMRKMQNQHQKIKPQQILQKRLRNNGQSSWSRYEQRGGQQRASSRNGYGRAGLRDGSTAGGSGVRVSSGRSNWQQQQQFRLSQRQRNGALRSAHPGGVQAQSKSRQRAWNAEYNAETRSYDLDHTA